MIEIAENLEQTSEQETQATKKFVFQLYDENIDYISSLSAESKNFLINKLLKNHRFRASKQKKNNDLIGFWKKLLINILIAAVGVPLFIGLINFSFEITVNNYSEMEKNFQKLFHK